MRGDNRIYWFSFKKRNFEKISEEKSDKCTINMAYNVWPATHAFVILHFMRHDENK